MNRALPLFAALLSFATAASAADAPTWRFAVSGDSRNCGDVVMPLIARGAAKDDAQFYWHLGDFRATYKFDEDFLAARGGQLTISEYLDKEWDDFISSQLAAFGTMPVYLGIGNHETIAPKTRSEYLVQFADWLDAPAVRGQRLADDPEDHRLKTYYHWKQGGVDFITLDNATSDMFDRAQLEWLQKVLLKDKLDASVRGIVLGMHEALPNSASCGHSMNDSAVGVETGRRVYRDLLKWRAETGKQVHLLASHSHYVMENIYDAPYWNNKKAGDRGVLPGWIVGTAGAIRYALPDGLPSGAFARTKTYGYLLADVRPDGNVAFQYRELRREDVPDDVVVKYGKAAVDACFEGNADVGFNKPSAPSCFER